MAAVGALVILLSLVWLSVQLIANDPVGLVLSFFVSVFAVVFFVWFVLTRRGAGRWLVVPIVVIALLALGTYGYDQKYYLAVMLVLLLLFGALARFAVRHDQAPVRPAAHGHARRLQPTKRGVLIINPRSGGGKAERRTCPAQARDAASVVFSARRRPAGTRRARGHRRRGRARHGRRRRLAGPRRLGRDAHASPRLRAAGTRNHFALDLGLDRDDVVGALDAFTDGVDATSTSAR